MPSVKPESSTRNAPITLARRSWRPSASCSVVRPSSTAVQASAGPIVGTLVAIALATQAGDRMGVVEGKRGSGRVDVGGSLLIKNKQLVINNNTDSFVKLFNMLILNTMLKT